MESEKPKGRPSRESWTRRLRIWRPAAHPFIRVVTNWRFLIAVVALLLVTNWLGHRWLFERATLAGTDVLLSVTKPRPAEHCLLVTIDEQEFEKYLGEWLQPEKLFEVLNVLLSYDPKVVAVDIETSAPRFKSMQIPAGISKIVWARVSHQVEASHPGERKRSYDWKTGEVLGSRPIQPEYVGSPLFPEDPDGVVRGFQRVVPVDAKVPSLPWVILRAACDAGAQEACRVVGAESNSKVPDARAQEDEGLQVRELHTDWEFRSIPLSDLMSEGGTARPHKGELGDIVLLGGKFNDMHNTPFGPKLGIELVGSAVESELAGEAAANKTHEWSAWFVKILLALMIAWLNTRLMPLWAAAGTLLLLSVVFVASFLGIYYGLFRMEFLPFMIGIWIEQLVESSAHAHFHSQ